MAHGLPDKVRRLAGMAADARLSDAAYRVASALLLHFHNTTTGRCYPSLQQVAEASAKHKATVIRALKHLKALGYVQIERSSGGRYRRHNYTFFPSETVAPDDHLEHQNGRTRRPFDDQETVAPSERNGRTQCKKRSHGATRINHMN